MSTRNIVLEPNEWTMVADKGDGLFSNPSHHIVELFESEGLPSKDKVGHPVLPRNSRNFSLSFDQLYARCEKRAVVVV